MRHSAINVFCPPAYSEELRKTHHLFSYSAFRACFTQNKGGGKNHWSDIISHLPDAVLPHFRNLQTSEGNSLDRKKWQMGALVSRKWHLIWEISPPLKKKADLWQTFLAFFFCCCFFLHLILQENGMLGVDSRTNDSRKKYTETRQARHASENTHADTDAQNRNINTDTHTHTPSPSAEGGAAICPSAAATQWPDQRNPLMSTSRLLWKIHLLPLAVKRPSAATLHCTLVSEGRSVCLPDAAARPLKCWWFNHLWLFFSFLFFSSFCFFCSSSTSQKVNSELRLETSLRKASWLNALLFWHSLTPARQREETKTRLGAAVNSSSLFSPPHAMRGEGSATRGKQRLPSRDPWQSELGGVGGYWSHRGHL